MYCRAYYRVPDGWGTGRGGVIVGMYGPEEFFLKDSRLLQFRRIAPAAEKQQQ